MQWNNECETCDNCSHVIVDIAYATAQHRCHEYHNDCYIDQREKKEYLEVLQLHLNIGGYQFLQTSNHRPIPAKQGAHAKKHHDREKNRKSWHKVKIVMDDLYEYTAHKNDIAKHGNAKEQEEQLPVFSSQKKFYHDLGFGGEVNIYNANL